MASTTQRVDRKEFRRVRASAEPKEKGQGPDNYIRVTAQRGQRSYISYAIALLNGEEGKPKQDTIKVSGMGAAIFNAVNIAEIVKRRVKGLHQVTEIASETVKDSYEGIESKKTLDVERKVATILITLSTKKLDAKALGYQAPLPEDQVTEQEERKPSERRAGSGRGGSGRGGRGSGRGSARGGRGGRGSARGGRGERKDGAEKKKDEKKETTEGRKSEGRGGRGSARGGRGSGRGAAASSPADKPAKKATTEPKAEATKPKTAKPDYNKLGEEFEDKLDRQKGDGHNKQAPKGESKPKSVRASK